MGNVSKFEMLAFEMEDIANGHNRENGVLVYHPYDNKTVLWNTSLGVGKKFQCMWKNGNFPDEQSDAFSHFSYMLDLSLTTQDNNQIYFIGWVNPYTLNPLEPLDEAEVEQETFERELLESTIKEHLKLKQQNFIDTIENDEIKKIIKEKTFFAGGCLTSLLLEEAVNDYDLFFIDMESCQKVFQYFVDKHNSKLSLSEHAAKEIILISKLSPSESDGVKDTMFKLSMRGSQIITKVPAKKCTNEVKKYECGFDCQEDDMMDYDTKIYTNNAISINDIQLIKVDYGQPEDVISYFDFGHCVCSYYPAHDELIFPEYTKKLVKEKKLVYNINAKHKTNSYFRLVKFLSRGFSISKYEHVKLLKAIHLNLLSNNINFSDLELDTDDYSVI